MKRTKPIDVWVGKEEDFQVQAMRYLRHRLAVDGVPPQAVMHIPNGGKYAHPRIAAKMKQAGVVAGYPDIMVFHQSDIHSGLALELKVWPNKPQDTQEAVHGVLCDAGWMVRVCYSMGEVEDAVAEYFGA